MESESEYVQSESPSHIKATRRKSYTIKDKVMALNKLSDCGGNIAEAARQLGIDRKCLRNWRDNKASLLNSKKPVISRRLTVTGRKSFYPELEDKLFEWIKEERGIHKTIVSYGRLREKAYEFKNELNITQFKCSDKWIFNFCKRHSLAKRKITHVGQQDNRPIEEKRELLANYLLMLQSAIKGQDASTIFNMDETPVYVDMLGSSTISFVGEKNVEAFGTGHGKTRFSVVLCASAAGKLLKSLIILKGLKKVPKCKIPKNLSVVVSKGGSMNEFIMKQWINMCFLNRGNFFATEKSLLIMDCFGSHKKESVLSELRKLNCEVLFIPPKTTCYLQPLDMGVNSSFKSFLRSEWCKWMAEGTKEFTAKGYRKRPSWEDVLKMVSTALDKIESKSITNSFECCGISPGGGEVQRSCLNSNLRSILSGSNSEHNANEDVSNLDGNIMDSDEIDFI